MCVCVCVCVFLLFGHDKMETHMQHGQIITQTFVFYGELIWEATGATPEEKKQAH